MNNSDTSEVTEVLQDQTEVLKNIADYFSETQELQRQTRAKRLFFKVVGIISFGIGGVIGSWELGAYLYEDMEVQTLADGYAKVAEAIYYEENNPKVALDFLDKAIELREDNTEYRYLKSYIDGMAIVRVLINLDRPYNQGEMDRAHTAIANAELLKNNEPNKPESYILKGQIYAALKEYDRAIDAFSTALHLNPRHDFALVRIAMVYHKKKQHKEALIFLDKALAIKPDSKWALLWKGKVLGSALHEWQKSREAYEQALKIDTRFDLGYYNLAWSWLQQKPRNYKNARVNFEKALSINPSFKEAFYGLSMVYGYQNHYEIAKTYLSKSIMLDDKFLTGWKYRAIMNDELGNYQEALNDLNKAIELSPSTVSLFVRRGRIYQKASKLDEAVNDLRFAASIEPNNKRIWLYLGRVFNKIKEYKKAINYFNKAIIIKKNYSEAYIGRAKAYQYLELWDKAEYDFNYAVEVTTYKLEKVFLARGKYFEARHQYLKALKDYRSATDKNKEFSEAWWLQAELLAKLNKKERAKQAINYYIELKPLDIAAFKLRDAL